MVNDSERLRVRYIDNLLDFSSIQERLWQENEPILKLVPQGGGRVFDAGSGEVL
jgi:hypothetical protein